MKTKVSLIIFIGTLIISCCVYGQTLKIGQKCPDILLKNVINYKTDTLRLSQFKAKLILLDFWATNCVSCIEAFPHIDSLQKEFKKEIQILTVTYDSKVKVQDFFSKRKFIKLPEVPFVTEDKMLHNLFPPESLPYHVWLDSTLTVKHITFGSNSTVETIRDFLDGENLQLYKLYDIPNKPKLETDSLLKYYSYIASCIPGTKRQSSNGEIINNKIYYSAECTSIIDFAKWTLSKIDNKYYDYKYPLIVDAKDLNRFKRTEKQMKDVWLKENAFSYYLMLPVSQKDQLYKFALQEIERYFNIKVVKEERKIPCIVLEKVPGYQSLKSKGGNSLDSLTINSIKRPVTQQRRYLQNVAFETFVNKIKAKAEFITSLPFIDETQIDYNIDISLSPEALDASNLDLLKKELEKWGLRLSEKDRFTKVIVIKDQL